eukprot:11204237-Lingulodinium_polyedra.AAC.1
MPPNIENDIASEACPGVTPNHPAQECALQLLPGDVALLALGAGGRFTMAAAGEQADLVATAGAWVRVE